MPVIVNGVELNDADLERELPLHAEAGNPMREAVTALVLRRVLLDEAGRQGLDVSDEESAIGALLASQAPAPEADDAACRRFYQMHPERFMVGELVEADHILFQVTPEVDLAALRLRAESVLEHLLAQPEDFATQAAALSNCPSGAQGGSLGQIVRGACVPEFERAVFAATPQGIIPRLVETRFGLHIVQVGRKLDGTRLPFEAVRENIAQALQRAAHDQALRHYLQQLVGAARITGVQLPGMTSPLLQ